MINIDKDYIITVGHGGAYEYAKELEEQDIENRTKPKFGCNSDEQ